MNLRSCACKYLQVRRTLIDVPLYLQRRWRHITYSQVYIADPRFMLTRQGETWQMIVYSRWKEWKCSSKVRFCSWSWRFFLYFHLNFRINLFPVYLNLKTLRAKAWGKTRLRCVVWAWPGLKHHTLLEKHLRLQLITVCFALWFWIPEVRVNS